MMALLRFGSRSPTTEGFNKAPMNSKTKLPDTSPTPLTGPCIPLFMARMAHAPAVAANTMLERPRKFATDFPRLGWPEKKASPQLGTSNTMATMTSAALALASVATLDSFSTSLEPSYAATASFQTERTVFTTLSFSPAS